MTNQFIDRFSPNSVRLNEGGHLMLTTIEQILLGVTSKITSASNVIFKTRLFLFWHHA